MVSVSQYIRINKPERYRQLFKGDNMIKKLVIVKSNAIIPYMGGVQGPILNPFYIDLQSLIILVNKRYEIYEVNPKNKSETVLLNIGNVTKVNFNDKRVDFVQLVNRLINKI